MTPLSSPPAPEPVQLLPGQGFSGLVQVAGVLDADEARMFVECGATCLGFPLRLDTHTPDTSEEEAARIIAGLPAHVTPLLITYESDPGRLVDLARFLGTAHVQFHADPEPETSAALLARIRNLAPDLFLIKSLIMNHPDKDAFAVMQALAPLVDAFILDSFEPGTGALGATGNTHDWDLSRKMVELSPKPVILAGGLNPDNVARAVRQVRPAGVDAHTGLEDDSGRKDRDKVQDFITRAQEEMARVPASPRPAHGS
ncbi:MAG: phosphoribosylanthranilate isomerase [Desulfovibrio sp.]|nr:MAG: phosphoribosylanthranilate isomerase [Desulfovibrio sp.]